MTTRNLLLDPCWSSKDLGQALPDSKHAVSVALPRWEDVIAYEEKDPKCMQALRAIYPRFGLNPIVFELAQSALKTQSWPQSSAWPFPNIATAEMAKEHCQRINKNAEVSLVEVAGLTCLITSQDATPLAKAFWQHTGLGASSRQAAIALNKEKCPSNNEGNIARATLKKRLANIYGCQESLIGLHPSGMAALTTALNAIKNLDRKGPVLQLGFPYVDVLKLPQVIFEGSTLVLNKEAHELERKLDHLNPSAVIVELPSNPMLRCIDLATVAKLAHDRGIPVIADDTIGSAANIDVLPYADLVFSSLTKSFAGRGDILAGALVISPNSHWQRSLKKIVSKVTLTQLSDPDSIALEEASRDCTKRIGALNKACLLLKNRLEKHSLVAKVLHPDQCPNFQALMRPDAGHGCLFSFELIGGLTNTKRFYDTLQICKGPSLGTNFSLVCPYVLLAHYKELDWAAACGIPSHLLRVSVGLEDPEILWNRFEEALNNCH